MDFSFYIRTAAFLASPTRTLSPSLCVFHTCTHVRTVQTSIDKLFEALCSRRLFLRSHLLQCYRHCRISRRLDSNRIEFEEEEEEDALFHHHHHHHHLGGGGGGGSGGRGEIDTKMCTPKKSVGFLHPSEKQFPHLFHPLSAQLPSGVQSLPFLLLPLIASCHDHHLARCARCGKEKGFVFCCLFYRSAHLLLLPTAKTRRHYILSLTIQGSIDPFLSLLLLLL